MGKHGLGERDLAANVNFFSRVIADENGDMKFDASHSGAGKSVSLRMEMDVFAVLVNCPHPMAPKGMFNGDGTGPAHIEMLSMENPGEDDLCRKFRAENTRGFMNTEKYLAALYH